jgi:general secretion pathway protein B
MSYILDALRRSQAERERGQVPGLHAQPAAAESPAGPARALPRWALPAAALALLGTLGLLLWWTRPQPAVVVVAAPPAPAPAAALPQVVSAPVPPPVVPPVVAAVVTRPAPASAAAPAPVASAPAPVVVAAPAPAPPAPRPVPLAQLSPEQRNALPPLVLSGSIWSDNAASRFVMINGQVVREGDTAAPGVVLERIQPKSAVLRWREMRIELPL